MSQDSILPSLVEDASSSVILINGRPATTSRDLAKFFDKRHDVVLRDIRKIITDIPEDMGLHNFVETLYTDEQNGQSYSMYHLYRDGFTLLAMGYTGQKAMQFKLAYIEAFNRMEAQLREPTAPALPSAEPAIENTETTKQLSVPFHDTTLCIAEHNGEPYVPLMLIGEGMGISWGGQMTMLNRNRAQWEFENISIKLKSLRSFLCMPLRLLHKYLNTIDSNIVQQGARSSLEFYQKECAQTLVAAWRSHKAGQEFLPSGDGEVMAAQTTLALPPAESALEITEASTQIFVPFLDTTLCLIDHNGDPYIPLALLVKGMGLTLGSQMTKLRNNPELWQQKRLLFTPPDVFFEKQGVCLPLRMLKKYLREISTYRMKPLVASRVELYQKECAQVLLDAWRAHRTRQIFLPSGEEEAIVELHKLVKTWGEISHYSPSVMKTQLQAAFGVEDPNDLNTEQMPQVLAWVQNKIDEVTAREKKRLSRLALDTVPSVPPKEESAFRHPALNDDNALTQADALMREFDNGQIQQRKELHVRIMHLVHWRFVGMEWFDLASNIIFCMLSASRCERSGGAGNLALPVQFAHELNNLLSRSRWQELDASRRPVA